MNNMKLGITLMLRRGACRLRRAKTRCQGEAKPSAAAPSALEVKIGHVGPLTGGIAHLGKDNENGARLAVEEANAAGTRIGGTAVKFTLVAEDDQADPKVGTTVAQSWSTRRSPAWSATSTPAPRSGLPDLQPAGIR